MKFPQSTYLLHLVHFGRFEKKEVKKIVGFKDREIQRINMLMRYMKCALLALFEKSKIIF
jgi:hypothetical protein